MKNIVRWAIAPLVLTATLTTAFMAQANPVQTPLSSPVVVRGNSGGSEAHESCRGFMFPDAPTQVVRVTSAGTSLRFRVEGEGQMALLITGPSNPICIPADGSSGAIEVPGVWQQGAYSVFVGDRANTSNPFTLSIRQGN